MSTATAMSTDDLSRNIDAYERNRKLLNEEQWGWSSVEDGKRIGQTIEEILRNSSESASTESLERLVALRDVVVHDRVEESRNIYDDYERDFVKGGVYSAGEIRRLADCELKRRGLVLHEGKTWTPEDLQKHLARKEELRVNEEAIQQRYEKSLREFDIWTYVYIAVLVILVLFIANL